FAKVFVYNTFYLILLFSLFVVSIFGTNTTLGKTSHIKLKVLTSKGNEVKLGELKHHVLIFKLYNKWRLLYRAFCSGSIITKDRVLTSAHCFYTNRKQYKHDLKSLKVVAGILHTNHQHPVHDDTQQWRRIDRVFSQKFYRFPAFSLAVLEINRSWIFNQFVDMIPYASRDNDFDGVCTATYVKPTKSWSTNKYVFIEDYQIIPRKKCQRILLRSCRLYYCTAYDNNKLSYASSESEGGGLICHGTGDPEEKDEKQGILVGVTSLIHIRLPSLHSRVGLFHKWITDHGAATYCSKTVLFISFIIRLFLW
ncbi:coagulation factor IX-like, partial [Achroia grisella]|uniref:coagulation factor IX-like n=1 Tax=Achroia grisella TaxID=688607 RepID=UPI0027D26B96